MSTLLAVLQLAMVPLLLAVALAVRFAGEAEVMTGVDYARVDQPAALHRWAGLRLMLLPLVFLTTGVLSWQAGGLALVLLGLGIAAGLVVAVWVMLGAEKFQCRS